MSEGWNCPVCGEGYPSADNAGVPEKGVIVLLLEEDMENINLPEHAVIRRVSDKRAEDE